MRRKRQHQPVQAFTMVELLVAIAVIAILTAIAFVALKYSANAAKTRSTAATLTNMKAMLAELQAANGLKSDIVTWSWWRAPKPEGPPGTDPKDHIVVGGNGGLDFWRIPYVEITTDSPNSHPDALDAPGDVSTASAQSVANRNGSYAMLNTSIAISRISAIPANRANLGKLSTDQTMVLRYASDNEGLAPAMGPIQFPGNDGVLDSSDSSTLGVFYPLGVQVKYTGANGTFIFRSTKPTNTLPSVTTDWTFDQATNPIPLDGWGNPLIFVPSTGLRVTLKESADGSDTGSHVYIITSPEGRVGRTAAGVPFVQQVGRPFFASAGPDGDFSKGDDNVYSFEH